MASTPGSESAVGLIAQSIYATSAVALLKIGTPAELGPRRFRYAYNGGVELAMARMLQDAAPVATHKDLVVAAAGIGASQVTVTNGITNAITKDQYAGGFLHVNDGTGFGQCYRIKGHPAAAASATCVITLWDELTVALVAAATSEVALTAPPYKGMLVVPNAALSAVARGVALIVVPINHYFWCQTKGPAPCWAEGTLAIGQPVGIGGTTDGACGPIGADTTDVWGRVMYVAADTDCALIDLMLE